MAAMVWSQRPSPEDWKALQVIAKYRWGQGMGPTLREVAMKMGLRAQSAARLHVLRLEELGLVTFQRVGTRSHVAARSLRLTGKGEAALTEYFRLVATGIYGGTREIVLTDAQYQKLKEAEFPLSAFRKRVEKEQTVLVCRDWVERDYWAELAVEVLWGNADEKVKG